LRGPGGESENLTKRKALRCQSSPKILQTKGGQELATYKLCVNGEVVSDPEKLQHVWADYFSTLAKSNRVQHSDLEELHTKMDMLSKLSVPSP